MHHRRLYGSLALDSQRACLRSRRLSVGDQCWQVGLSIRTSWPKECLGGIPTGPARGGTSLQATVRACPQEMAPSPTPNTRPWP